MQALIAIRGALEQPFDPSGRNPLWVSTFHARIWSVGGAAAGDRDTPIVAVQVQSDHVVITVNDVTTAEAAIVPNFVGTKDVSFQELILKRSTS